MVSTDTEFVFDDALSARPHRRRLNAEAAIRVVAWVLGISGTLTLVTFAFLILLLITRSELPQFLHTDHPYPHFPPWANYAIATSLAVVCVVSAIALARYRSWARWLALVVLIENGAECASGGAVPIPWLIFAIIALVALFGRRGRTVFRPEYADTLAAEPELRPAYRDPLIMWLIGTLLLSLLISGLEIPLP